jgi:hypothetical protein
MSSYTWAYVHLQSLSSPMTFTISLSMRLIGDGSLVSHARPSDKSTRHGSIIAHRKPHCTGPVSRTLRPGLPPISVGGLLQLSQREPIRIPHP